MCTMRKLVFTGVCAGFLFLVFLPGVYAGEEATGNPAPSETSAHYKIGVGDVLKINVWKEPDLSIEAAAVRLDGMVTIALIDDVRAEGRTTMELKQVIEENLGEYVESPQVTVTLLKSGSRKYYILGEVKETGEYPIYKDLTILQAFSIAKGFTEWASKKEILLFRREGGKDKLIRVNYKKIIDGDISNNVYIKADDTIIVP